VDIYPKGQVILEMARARAELEVASFKVWAEQGYPSDTSSPPAFSTKTSDTAESPAG